MLNLILLLFWVVLALISLASGQFHIPLEEIFKILFSGGGDEAAKSVMLDVRIPRILLSSLCGGALAIAGLSLQAVFKNPLVGPHIVGVSTAAAFGGALCILLGLSGLWLAGFAFCFGLAALFLLYLLAKFVARADINGVFAALTSLVQYLADDEEVLPNIVFWLLGSFVSAGYDKVILMCAIALPASAVLIALRWRVNLLSLNDDDLRVLGVDVKFLRCTILALCTALIAVQVSVSGNIGWVGLVVPHATRLIAGSDHVKLMPACFIAGAIFMLAIDDLSRSLSSAEIPLGILSALIGSPIFALLLKRSAKNAKSN